ncbi:hypothetical protein WICPIJ_009519 [Wickerhamomyces pijperi]|uniref:Uncharacterized protein n=1 Tax=Wickerhamomyces pijperi TaxID=599730 RepID=A0A9P8PM35_WICPI|nr:hypothetical protein WICPIJ_009519 [Wickerhamomyces pijperi]
MKAVSLDNGNSDQGIASIVASRYLTNTLEMSCKVCGVPHSSKALVCVSFKEGPVPVPVEIARISCTLDCVEAEVLTESVSRMFDDEWFNGKDLGCCWSAEASAGCSMCLFNSEQSSTILATAFSRFKV